MNRVSFIHVFFKPEALHHKDHKIKDSVQTIYLVSAHKRTMQLSIFQLWKSQKMHNSQFMDLECEPKGEVGGEGGGGRQNALRNVSPVPVQLRASCVGSS